jgi:hydrogenase-4 component B
MSDLSTLLVAIATLGISGVPALFFRAGARRGQWLAAGLMLLGSALGLTAAIRAATAPEPVSLTLAWGLPIGQLALAVDGLSAVFLLPVFVVPALGAVYGLGYWGAAAHPETSRRLGFFFGVLAAAMALVVIARDSIVFLVAWEMMALAAFFLTTTEDNDARVCQGGWVYLIATHLGTLCLMAMFALLHAATGSWAIQPILAAALTPGMASTLFVLGLVGFGVKAGLMPVHVWLPGAHANAPSHVSAVMSGVMLKMGIYGIVRLTSLLLAPPTWWGGLLLALGAMSGILGIAFAIGQSDLKRLLAYSSIENVGIITMGLGLALLGKALDQTLWVVLGLGGAILHTWNHSLFKSLLFFNAGAVIHGVETREIDRLGGLAKRMPLTAGLFAVGSVAICALPPLNGFAGEFVIYQGLMRTVLTEDGPAWPAAALGAVALAAIGALAVVCFVRVLGTVFLGEPRTESAAHAHDPGPSLLAPMFALAFCCLILGLLPWLAAPVLLGGVASWSGNPGLAAYPLEEWAPLQAVGVLGGTLLFLTAVLGVFLKLALKNQRISRAGTWDCGYARPTPRIQYTGSSFGQTVVELFNWALWPRREVPELAGPLPRPTRFSSVVPDTVLDRLVLPVFRFGDRLLPVVRLLQQGRLNVYLLYIPGMVLALWLWKWIGG